jgi:predicted transposase YbfD/YdcC
MSAAHPALAIQTHFAKLRDCRINRTRQHQLLDIVVIAICGVICGAEGWVDIAKYGHAKHDWLKKFLTLPNGIPSHDTFRRVFCLLDPAAFQACFQSWIDALSEGLGLKRVAIDGKTLRRSFDRSTGKAALPLVSAWACEQHLVLGQVAVDSKSNEITAIPKLLDLRDVSGAIVTIDAMGCQKDSAAKIRAAQADDVLSVKDNPPRLWADIQECFADGFDSDFAEVAYRRHEEVSRGHGRVETPTVHTIQHPEGIRDLALWEDLTTLTLVVSTRQEQGKQETVEARYYLGSKAAQARSYASFLRGHWSIANGLPWVLDVRFDEDPCRMRTDHRAENRALRRRLALALLKQHGKKGSVRGKRLESGWNNDMLEEILSGK